MQNNPGDPSAPIPPDQGSKVRDPLFDVAKGIGILFVLGIHSSNNSSRLYTNSHSVQWWGLTVLNRLCCFAVPLFLLISAILAARSLASKPQVLPFYRRRLIGVAWPYLVWSAIYIGLRLFQDPATRKIETVSILGLRVTGPALFVHLKPRLLELLWGKASFHLYFMVVLFQLLILLPPTVAYLRWRKPGFYEMLATAFVLQGAILVIQHVTAIAPYPASTAFWYVGSLLPSAWIGLNWDSFKENPHRYSILLALVSAVAGFIYLRGEIQALHHLPVDNYLQNGSTTVYASCVSILVFAGCFQLVKVAQAKRFLLPFGLNSLEIYLIHPLIIWLLAKQVFAGALNATYLGPLLSPILVLAITFALVWVIRTLRLGKAIFGR